MLKRVKESELCLFLILIGAIISVYGLCFSLKIYFAQVNEESLHDDKFYNPSKYTKMSPTKAKLSLMEIQEVQENLLRLSISIELSWTESYSNLHSKVFSDIAETVSDTIEDFYDKMFDDETNSITIIVDCIEKYPESDENILVIKMEVSGLERIVSLSDVQNVVESGAEKLFFDIESEMIRRQSGSDKLKSTQETASIESENESIESGLKASSEVSGF